VLIWLLREQDIALPTAVRKEQLGHVYRFDCDCDRCTRGLVLNGEIDVDRCMADGSDSNADEKEKKTAAATTTTTTTIMTAGRPRSTTLQQADELLQQAMVMCEMGAETEADLNAERTAVEEALALRLSVLHPLSLCVNEATKMALQVSTRTTMTLSHDGEHEHDYAHVKFALI
jgi:hypothetical protein